MKTFLAVLVLVTLVQCAVIQDNENVLKSVIENFVSCGKSDLSLCMKEKALIVTERFGSLRQLKLVDGITIINNAPHREVRNFEPLSDDVQVRRQQVSQRLAENTAKLLENTDLEVTIGTGDDEVQKQETGVEEGRDKKKKEAKKKIKMLMPLLNIIKLKLTAALAVALVVAAYSLFKLVLIAKIAFFAKALFILKELLSKHKQQVDWVPHHDEFAHHDQGWDGGHGWGRSGKNSHNLAYSAYRYNKI